MFKSVKLNRVLPKTFPRPRFYSQVAHTRPAQKNIFAVSAVALAGYSIYRSYNDELKLDLLPQLAMDNISVDSAVDPFPTQVLRSDHDNLSDDYQLLGHGVRAVTFLGFKVYAIGIYISKNQTSQIKQVLSPQYLSTFSTENHSLQELLQNPDHSQEIIAKLVDSGINFVIRILPVRNTDFGHLKDGLVKSILANKMSKTFREPVGEGLEQLRDVFKGFKGSVPKNHLMWFEYNSTKGTFTILYENPTPGKRVVRPMGIVTNPWVGRILMLLYLSGLKPLSEPLRKSCIDGFVGL